MSRGRIASYGPLLNNDTEEVAGRDGVDQKRRRFNGITKTLDNGFNMGCAGYQGLGGEQAYEGGTVYKTSCTLQADYIDFLGACRICLLNKELFFSFLF